MHNPLKRKYVKTTVVVSVFLAAFGFLQFYLYTTGREEDDRIGLPHFSAIEASFESRRPLTIPITIVTAASGNHACALEAYLYHMQDTLDQLHTDPREDQRRAEDRIKAGREYLETSPDLANIRKKNKGSKPLTMGKNSPESDRKVKTNGEDHQETEQEVAVVEEGKEIDMRRARSLGNINSNHEVHRRQIEDNNNNSATNDNGSENNDISQSTQDLLQQPPNAGTTLVHDDADHTTANSESEIKYEIRPTVVVYNMGMGPTKRKKRLFQALIEAGYIDQPFDFDFNKYPDFWRLGTSTRGEYGWKSGIIEEVTQRMLASPPSSSNKATGGRHEQGIVLWLDSGDRISASFLRWLPSFLLQHGLWSPQSQDNMHTWTHPGLLSYYNDSLDNYAPEETNCNGAAMAFDVRNHTVRDGIMREWVQCARTKECIAPEGSSRANHRQDQAALTYLVKRMGYGHDLCYGMPEIYNIQVNQDRWCKSDVAAQPDRVVYA
ncbi:hypothetical protein FBU30_010240 [Linnemannia zychae]|nr:hypothetical protein FBU30_010240 [Linnemannia zychae]